MNRSGISGDYRLDSTKSCCTCISGGNNANIRGCNLSDECICSKEYKKHWKICLMCVSCKHRYGAYRNYVTICKPCFRNGYANWESNNDVWEGHNKKPTTFKIPYI